MVLPIIAYGHPTLRKVASEISRDHPGLDEIIQNLFDTLYSASGVGLAAPQINSSVRVIIIDASPFANEHPELKSFKKVFINPSITNEEGEEWLYNEGCLSIPEIREDVLRKPKIRIHYYDRDFNFHDEEYVGIPARIIQHEYDHLEGKLFVDRISSLRKMLLKRKLNDITNGNISVAYKMIFPGKLRKKVKI
jgi:peptide deformylase